MAEVEVSIRFADLDRVRLLIWELVQLRERLADPEAAEWIEHMVDRFMADITRDFSA